MTGPRPLPDPPPGPDLWKKPSLDLSDYPDHCSPADLEPITEIRAHVREPTYPPLTVGAHPPHRRAGTGNPSGLEGTAGLRRAGVGALARRGDRLPPFRGRVSGFSDVGPYLGDGFQVGQGCNDRERHLAGRTDQWEDFIDPGQEAGREGPWARHWAGKSRHIPACLPEKYGRSCVLPVKSRQYAGIWPV